MDLKLQQAIVATRAGRNDIAQQLLAKLISEQPDNSHAWFLLGHLVEPKDRQIRYLQKALALDPQNEVAKNQIAYLTSPPVPPPVIAREEKSEKSVSSQQEEESVHSVPTSPAPSQTNPQVVKEQDTPSSQQQLPEWLQDLENKKLVPAQTAAEGEQTWTRAAKTPKREAKPQTPKTRVLHIPQNAAETKSQPDRTKEEIWLLRILTILVIIAAIVLGFLVLMILLQN